jgi:hypothetical protein
MRWIWTWTIRGRGNWGGVELLPPSFRFGGERLFRRRGHAAKDRIQEVLLSLGIAFVLPDADNKSRSTDERKTNGATLKVRRRCVVQEKHLQPENFAQSTQMMC